MRSIAYGHTGCDTESGAKAMMGFSGCSGRLFGWATVFCGVEIEVRGPDYVTDVAIAESSILFPRTLVPATEVNGKLQNKIECSNPIECQQRCEYLGTIARDNGLPAPSACALCHPPCPSDGATTAVDFIHAFFNDLVLILRLTAICGFTLGIGEACVCEIFMLLKPAWMQNLDDPVDRCEGGDVFSIIATQIEGMIVRTGEGLVNDAVIKPINGILNAMFMPGLDEVCFEHEPSNKFCPNPDDILGSLVECNFDKANAKLHEGCYFEYELNYRTRTPLASRYTPIHGLQRGEVFCFGRPRLSKFQQLVIGKYEFVLELKILSSALWEKVSTIETPFHVFGIVSCKQSHWYPVANVPQDFVSISMAMLSVIFQRHPWFKQRFEVLFHVVVARKKAHSGNRYRVRVVLQHHTQRYRYFVVQ